jgi:hypothetical protein
MAAEQGDYARWDAIDLASAYLVAESGRLT